MGKISEIFNFDNIGGKIKGLVKWSCWITILCIWIAAPISFFVLVSDEWTAYLCWIPIVAAIVGPISVWISSWVLYAFAEIAETAVTNRLSSDGVANVVAESKPKLKLAAYFTSNQKNASSKVASKTAALHLDIVRGEKAPGGRCADCKQWCPELWECIVKNGTRYRKRKMCQNCIELFATQ